jgi:hypothetical protein
MKRNNLLVLTITGTVAVLAGFTAGVQAIPIPISGTLSFAGSATTDTGNFTTATKFTQFQSITVGAPSTLFGDYVGTSGAAVTITPFTFNPANASTPINPLWTFTSGGDTYSFSLSTLHEDFASPTGLLLSGFGTATITGPGTDYLATSGLWNLSAQTFNVSTFTFSSTTQVPNPITVPDGGSTAILLGGALCGLGILGRKVKV